MGRNAILIAVALTLVAVALVMATGRGDVATKAAAPVEANPATTTTATASVVAAPTDAPAPVAAPAVATAVEAPAAAPAANVAVAAIVAPRFGPVHGEPVDAAKLDADGVHMQAIGALLAPEAAKAFERCLGAAGGALQPMSFQLELNKVPAASAGGRPQVALSSIQPSAGMIGPDSDALSQWQRCSSELREVRVQLPQVHDAAPEHGFITVMIQVPEPFAVKLAAASAGAKAPSEVAK
jgi:hypothetical protein